MKPTPMKRIFTFEILMISEMKTAYCIEAKIPLQAKTYSYSSINFNLDFRKSLQAKISPFSYSYEGNFHTN